MIDLNTLQQDFKGSGDVMMHRYHFGKQSVLLIYSDAMIDSLLLNEVVLPRLEQLDWSAKELTQTIQQSLYVPELQQHTQVDKATSLVYHGQLLIYIESEQLLFSTNISNIPNRNPEETRAEVTVKGPRDNFIESLPVNIALIRKRLPTHSLHVEKLTIGQRSQTTVALIYFADIVDLKILEELKNQLQKIQTDIVMSGDILMEQVNKSAPLFPRTDYTGRADFAMQALARGRFIILIDGVAYAIITPINFFMLLKSGEDNEYPVFFSSFERLLRILGILIGALLPAFWLALTTTHQSQLPFLMLATVVQANNGLPLPSAVEMILMLLLFELLREAGFRLPSVIGGTIGVVGGLIIGDAAIRAGITSPAMVVVIATSTIATYTLVNQSLSTAITLIRLLFILTSSIFGFFGFFLSLFCLLIYLANIRTFGVPYLNIAADLTWETISKSFLRLPPKKYKHRPKVLKTQDDTRNKDD